MNVTVIPIVIGGLGAVSMNLEKRKDEVETRRIDITETIALLKPVSILRRVLDIWEDFLSSRRQWKTRSLSWCERSTRNKTPRFDFFITFKISKKYHHWRIYSVGIDRSFALLPVMPEGEIAVDSSADGKVQVSFGNERRNDCEWRGEITKKGPLL